jgi:glycosyltransferase involved in cell wall biosynthesis
VLVGRGPTAEIRALTGPDVRIAEDVPDVLEEFGAASLAVFPGGYGRGTRNSVLEALRAGCPVVASPASARGIARNPGMLVVDDESLPAAVERLLGRPDLLRDMRSSAWDFGQRLPDWDAVAASYHRLLTEVARPCRRRDDPPPPQQPRRATA